jgi:predicted short-subunit dehydrogenase-like oxidoreductase (DUF2520 family)
MKIAIVGAGRSGTSFATALSDVGYEVRLIHHDELERIGDADVVLLCVPDDAIAEISADLEPSDSRVVVHVAGSKGLADLARHPRAGFMHPLAMLSTGELGAHRLHGATFSVGGDSVTAELVVSLEGRALHLSDDQRVNYHATAAVAANHMVALMGHVEVLAESAGLSLRDFVPLIEQALGDTVTMGAQRALTGPASRGDMKTIDAHLAAIPESERSTYVALANAAFELAEARRLASAP